MSAFKNLKIEINETQPIDVVLKELERLGYKPLNTQAIKEWYKWLVADCNGVILGWRNASILGNGYYKTVILEQIKEM